MAFFAFLLPAAGDAPPVAAFFAFLAFGASALVSAATATGSSASAAASAADSPSPSASSRSRFFSNRPLPSLVALRSALLRSFSCSRAARSAASFAFRSFAAFFPSSCSLLVSTSPKRASSEAV